jgi:hypothetical protein
MDKAPMYTTGNIKATYYFFALSRRPPEITATSTAP